MDCNGHEQPGLIIASRQDPHKKNYVVKCLVCGKTFDTDINKSQYPPLVYQVPQH